jgi:ribosomal protein L6P/L9E
MSIVFLGLQKGYFQYLKIRGMGYKFVNASNAIILKFGFSHRTIYINPINAKCKFISRYFLRLESRSL